MFIGQLLIHLVCQVYTSKGTIRKKLATQEGSLFNSDISIEYISNKIFLLALALAPLSATLWP